MVMEAFYPDLPMLEEHQQQNTTCIVMMPSRNALKPTTRPVMLIFKISTLQQPKRNVTSFYHQGFYHQGMDLA